MGRVSIWVSLAILLLALPWVSTGYVVFLACLCGVNIVATLGLNITTGYTGLLSLSHAGFVAVGAYTTALMSNHFGVPILVCILLSGVMASLVGGVFGLPSFRLKGVYLAVATLAAQYNHFRLTTRRRNHGWRCRTCGQHPSDWWFCI